MPVLKARHFSPNNEYRSGAGCGCFCFWLHSLKRHRNAHISDARQALRLAAEACGYESEGMFERYDVDPPADPRIRMRTVRARIWNAARHAIRCTLGAHWMQVDISRLLIPPQETGRERS